jgi:hypothetical protein
VTNEGSLAKPPETFGLDGLVATMEALLIEGLEPPLNRRQGDDFASREFLQDDDPSLLKKRTKAQLEEILQHI